MLAAPALGYAARGWAVFPVYPIASDGHCACTAAATCTSPGKHPITSNGLSAATRDPETITEWFDKRHLNVGIRGGVESALFFLDIDPRSGGDTRLAELEATHGTLPLTYTVETGSGGRHYYFKHPGGTAWRSKIALGVDIKCDGGYVIAPPSNHKSGAPYRVENDLEIADAPPWLVAMARAEEKPPAVETPSEFPPATKEILDEAEAQLKAQEDTTGTFAGACLLVRDWALGDIEALPILDRWLAVWNARGLSEPPLPRGAEHLLKVLKGARERGTSEFAVKRREHEFFKIAMAELFPTAPEVASDDPLARARALVLEHLGRHDAAKRVRFRDAEELFTKPLPVTPWLLRGIVPEKALLAISGEPKTTKTWCELEIALAIANGRAAFDEFEAGPPRKVALFLVEDDERAVRNRLRSLAKSRGLVPETAVKNIKIICRQTRDLADENHLIEIVAALLDLGEIAAVFFDPLRDMHTSDEDNSTGMSAVMYRLRIIRDIFGASVIFVHHSSKSSVGNSGRRQGQKMRGSGAIHGAVDGGIYLHDLETDGQSYWTNKVEIELKAVRGGGRFNLRLDVKDDENGEAVLATWSREKQEATAVLPEKVLNLRERILRELREAWRAQGGKKEPTKGISARVLADRTKKRRDEVLTVLKGLVASGHARDLDPDHPKNPQGGFWLIPQEDDFDGE